jgi:benzoylformate decarboxylase
MVFPEPDAPVLGPQTKLIQIDANSWQIGRNVTPTIGILSDAKFALLDLIETARGRQNTLQAEAVRERVAAITAQTSAARERYYAGVRGAWDSTPISAARLMSEIHDALPANSHVFAEPVTNRTHFERYIQSAQPDRTTVVRGGGIGGGLPGTLGAALARPDHKMVGVCADGSSMYSITALWTAAHHNLPVTWVMLNNGAYRILKLNLLAYLGEGAKGRKFVEMDLAEPKLRFDHMAESMGVQAWRVETPEQIGPALREAFKKQGPTLVDVVIDGSLPVT